MAEILLGLGVMGACFLLMGAGLLFRRRKICLRGSCGGKSSGDKHPDIGCPTCEGDAGRCAESGQSESAPASGGDKPVQ